MGGTARALTNANMGLEDHADVISSISDRQCDWVLFGGFDQLHNLERSGMEAKVTSHLGTLTSTNHQQLFHHYPFGLTSVRYRHSCQPVQVPSEVPVPALSGAAPFDSRAQRCSCGRFLRRSLCSSLSLSPPGRASSPQRGWLHQW